MGDKNKHAIWASLLSSLLLITTFFSKKWQFFTTGGAKRNWQHLCHGYPLNNLHATFFFVLLIPSTRIFLVKAVYMVLGSSYMYFSSGKILVLGRSSARHKCNPGSSKLTRCWQKLLPTWLVSAGYSA